MLRPTGTVTTSFVVVAEFTVAAVPLNSTAFWFGVVLKPVPWIATVFPTGPRFGENSITDTEDVLWREIERMFPTAS